MRAENKTNHYGEKTNVKEMILEDLSEGVDHGIIVSNLTYLLTGELHLEQNFRHDMAIAGLLHDIGKIRLSKYLYGRDKDTLQIEEMKYVRMHSTYSYEILKKQGYPNNILEVVYHHHENYDGSGYPDNLKGENIPLGARIIRTCDVFAALTSVRPYRDAFLTETAMELMIEEIKNFDMKIFLAFQRIIHSDDFAKLQEFIEASNQQKVPQELRISFAGII